MTYKQNPIPPLAIATIPAIWMQIGILSLQLIIQQHIPLALPTSVWVNETAIQSNPVIFSLVR
jgi:hypothetical protein